MFDNIGGKIKMVAKLLCWIGIAASVIGGIGMIGFDMVLAGVVTIVAGCLCSWLGSLCMYGFGQLIESVKIIEARLVQTEKKAAPPAVVHSIPAGHTTENQQLWRCKNCGMMNGDARTSCTSCGQSR